MRMCMCMYMLYMGGAPCAPTLAVFMGSKGPSYPWPHPCSCAIGFLLHCVHTSFLYVIASNCPSLLPVLQLCTSNFTPDGLLTPPYPSVWPSICMGDAAPSPCNRTLLMVVLWGCPFGQLFVHRGCSYTGQAYSWLRSLAVQLV